jgi:hypothetical protein
MRRVGRGFYSRLQDLTYSGVPTNAEARKVVESWLFGRKCESSFYNLETGKPLVGRKSGFENAPGTMGVIGVSCHTLRPAASLVR